jgi:hypothetical protein
VCDVHSELDHLVGLAGDIQDGVVRGLQPDVAAIPGQAAKPPGNEVTTAQSLPKARVLIGLGKLGLAEHAVVLAHHVLTPVAKGLQEVRIGVQHPARQVELDHGLHAVNRRHLALKVCLLHPLRGDVGGQLDHAHHVALSVPHRVVRGLQPDRLARLGDPQKHILAHLSGAQPIPQRPIRLAAGHLGRAKNAVVLPQNLAGAVAHEVQKQAVGPQYPALQVKFDHGLHMLQRSQQRRCACGLLWGGSGRIH